MSTRSFGSEQKPTSDFLSFAWKSWCIGAIGPSQSRQASSSSYNQDTKLLAEPGGAITSASETLKIGAFSVLRSVLKVATFDGFAPSSVSALGDAAEFGSLVGLACELLVMSRKTDLIEASLSDELFGDGGAEPVQLLPP